MPSFRDIPETLRPLARPERDEPPSPPPEDPPTEHQMQEVGNVFGLHPLAVEDAVCAHQRPKLERYDETLFLVLKTVNYVPHESVALAREIVETGEVMIFVGKDFVVTVSHGAHSGLADVRKSMETDIEQLRLG